LLFESWRAAEPLDRSGKPAALFVAPSRNRKRQALLGGAIGAAAGVVFCTAVSTLANDSAEGGLSFCPLDSYLLIGGAGFALGAAIGWVI
jgi:ABC-type branched-subunit amino acid transport system permease subunit